MTASCRNANPCRHRCRECPGGVGRRGRCVGDSGPATQLPFSHFWKKITSVNIFVVFIGACPRSLILVSLTFTWHSVLNDTSHLWIFHWHFPLVYLLHPQQVFVVLIVVEYFWKAFTSGRLTHYLGWVFGHDLVPFVPTFGSLAWFLRLWLWQHNMWMYECIYESTWRKHDCISETRTLHSGKSLNFQGVVNIKRINIVIA